MKIDVMFVTLVFPVLFLSNVLSKDAFLVFFPHLYH